jgi:DNA-binding IclR family transcriptional regulator
MSTIRTLDRAFSILQIVARHPAGIGVSAVAAELELAKSTTSRLLAAMDSWEIVERTADNRFKIGPEPVRWLGHQAFTATLPALARPILQRIADETGEAAAICILQGFQVLYLDHVQSYQDIQVRDWTGEVIPLHVSSAGKVLLAHSKPDFVEAFLQRPLAAFTDRSTITPEKLREELSATKIRGYALTDEEYAEGIIGLAAPVFNGDGDVVAAVNVYGPRFRLSAPDTQAQIVEVMKAEVETLLPKGRKDLGDASPFVPPA